MNSHKNRKNSLKDDERGERILKLLFPSIDRTLRKLKQLLDDFDPEIPHTTRAKFNRILETLAPVSPIAQRFVIRVVKAAVRNPVFREGLLRNLDKIISIAKTEAQKDKRYSLLLKLMHEVDRKAPLAGSIVTFRHGDPDKWFEIHMNSFAKIEKATSLSGERRASAAREAFRDTVDFVYTPYVKTLVCLSLVRSGKKPEDLKSVNDMKFGVAVDHLTKKLSDYPQLFDRRAAWMRNSIAHEFLIYDLATDTIVFRDTSQNPVAFSTNELLEITTDMYQLAASTAPRVGQLYLFREIFRDRGLGKIFLEYLPELANANDPEKVSRLEEQLKKDIEKNFKPK